MDRKEFDKSDVIEQIDYINSLLNENKTLTNISNDLGIGRTTIRNRFKKAGFVFSKDNNTYIKEYDDGMTSGTNEEIEQSMTRVIHNGNDESHALVINNELQSNIVELAENHKKIMDIVKWFESDDNSMTKGISNIIEVVEEGIKIQLPNEIDKDYRTTVRVNKEIWNKFKSFSEKNRQFTQKDLLSQALKEFMDKHDR